MIGGGVEVDKEGGGGQNLDSLDMVPTLPKIFTYFRLNTNNFHYPKGVENTNPYDSTVD